MLNAITLMSLKLAAAAPAGGEAKGETPFPPFDSNHFATQIFWLLLTFGILYFLLSRIFLPRIGQTIEERSSRIADDLDAASRMQKEAEEAEKSYERALAEARAKAHNVAETTRQSVDAEIEAEMEAADAKASKAAEAAETRIRAVRTKAMANIEAVAADAAQATVEALTGKKPTLATVKKALN
ncbi:F0F1 ATP synthase subunit B' [Hellea sp.]|nr:F0F1 ATP synthase subunit B' [Hellea sp.]